MKNIKISKLIITLGIFFSLIISFYFIFLRQESIINFNTISFYTALLIYEIRYLYLINISKRDRVTFQLIEKQKYPVLLDTIVGIFLFGILPFVMAFLHVYFKAFEKPVFVYLLIFVLYITGTIITLVSERQRLNWKKNNPGKLYTEGLFAFSNHINYFGEMLSLPALFYLATESVLVFFAFLIHQIVDFTKIQIPKQEAYLQKKYTSDYNIIRDRKKLIPWIY